MMRPPCSQHRALRGVLGFLVVLGLLVMCHAAWSSPAGGVVDGVGVVATDSVSRADAHTLTPTTSVTEPDDGGAAGCCAILIACIIALVGLGAMLIVRARHRGRILWGLPAGLRRIDGVSVLVLVELFSRKRPAVLIC